MLIFRSPRFVTAFMSLALVAFASSAGCGRYSHVNWGNPGRAEVQQARAVWDHDPYPDPDAGPEVVGGRPRAFDTPPPEAAWLQKRDPYNRSRTAQPQFSAQPVYTTPVYQPNYTTPAYNTPVYQPPVTAAPVYQQPSSIPLQPIQPNNTAP